MTHDEMIEFVNAIRDGKTVQYRLKGCVDHGWTDSVHGALPNFGTFDYRVKPMPRELWINPSDFGPLCITAYRTDKSAMYATLAKKPVKFVEVIE